MTDFFMRDDGDLALSPSGDIAITDTPYRDDLQQAYIRVMTDEGDHLLYPNLGATLSQLYGMPQSPETGRLGEDLITDALNREGRFAGQTFAVKAVPVSPNTIRFDIIITMSNQEQVSLAIEQVLAFDSLGPPALPSEPPPPDSDFLLIPAAAPSPGFPGGNPDIWMSTGLAAAGSSSPHLVTIVGDRPRTLSPPFPGGSPTMNFEDKVWLAGAGSSNPHLRVNIEEDS